jgi:hypothetical protein
VAVLSQTIQFLSTAPSTESGITAALPQVSPPLVLRLLAMPWASGPPAPSFSGSVETSQTLCLAS